MAICMFQHHPYSLLTASVDQLRVIGDIGELIKASIVEAILHQKLEQDLSIGFCMVMNSELIIAAWVSENYLESNYIAEDLPLYLAHERHGAVIRVSTYTSIAHALTSQ